MNDTKRNKTRRIINICYFAILAAMVIMCVYIFADLNRQADEIAQSPSFSGVDMLGIGIGYVALMIIGYIAFITVTDIYFCLRYYLFSEKIGWKSVINGISFALSAVSLVFLAVAQFTGYDVVLSAALLWSAVYPMFRLIYGIVGMCRG